MTAYRFRIHEVSREGFIAWDAIEEGLPSSQPIPLESPMVVGAYPEIAAYLAKHRSVKVTLIYAPSLGDSFDQASQTWTFQRGSDQITVADIPRTVLRVSVLTA